MNVLEKYNGVLSYEAMMEMSYIDQIINGKRMHLRTFAVNFHLTIFS